MPESRPAGPTADAILDDTLSNQTTALTLGTALPRLANKTLTFTGASGLGLHGTASTIFTVTGFIYIEAIAVRCTTSLTGANATLTFGVVGATTLFIGTTTATSITTSAELWIDATPAETVGVALPAGFKGILVNAANVIISSTHASADVASGVLEIDMVWRPLTSTATVV